MNPILCLPDASGRFRVSDFFCKLHDSKVFEDVQEETKGLFHGVKQILCAGYLPVQADGTPQPMNVEPTDGSEYHLYLFVLKSYDSDIRMWWYPNRLSFQRGPTASATPVYTSPKCGRGDFLMGVIRRLKQLRHFAVDQQGNELCLEEQLASEAKKQSTKIITSIKLKGIKRYQEVVEESPVLAFQHEKKLRRFIQVVNDKEQRGKEQTNFREIKVD